MLCIAAASLALQGGAAEPPFNVLFIGKREKCPSDRPGWRRVRVTLTGWARANITHTPSTPAVVTSQRLPENTTQPKAREDYNKRKVG
ncbi:unnamed protein product [Jaminaea pallidilutea]